jgi:UDP-2-acetamido-3-amino-2,3-dideoxy-glucuronate N-acetyltransferase
LISREEVRIDRRAVVENLAKIGKGSAIWHFSHIRSGSEIGTNCIIGRGVYVDEGVIIGNDCKLQNGCMIYNGVEIENRVFIGPQVVFTNDINPRAHIWSEEKIVKTLVEEGASIGANSTIRCGIKLGKWCMIGAGSVVTKDVPPHALVLGIPARIVGWMTKEGEKLEIDVDEGMRGGDFTCVKNGTKVRLTNTLEG